MYIPEFVCGIISTILFEFIFIIVYTFYVNWKGKKWSGQKLNLDYKKDVSA